jgi:hypothetical protein
MLAWINLVSFLRDPTGDSSQPKQFAPQNICQPSILHFSTKHPSRKKRRRRHSTSARRDGNHSADNRTFVRFLAEWVFATQDDRKSLPSRESSAAGTRADTCSWRIGAQRRYPEPAVEHVGNVSSTKPRDGQCRGSSLASRCIQIARLAKLDFARLGLPALTLICATSYVVQIASCSRRSRYTGHCLYAPNPNKKGGRVIKSRIKRQQIIPGPLTVRPL